MQMKIFFFFLLAFLLESTICICGAAYAFDRDSRIEVLKQFDYSFYAGHFDPVAPCDVDGSAFDLIPDPKNFSLRLVLQGGFAEKFPFTHINQGRHKFDSCFSDGVIGYSETVGEGQVVKSTTVYQNPGLFCRGGSEKYRRTRMLKLVGDQLSITEKNSLASKTTMCIFERKPLR